MSDELTAEEVRSLLNLEPNATCGFVRGTYVSGSSIAVGACRHPSPTRGRWDRRCIFW